MSARPDGIALGRAITLRKAEVETATLQGGIAPPINAKVERRRRPKAGEGAQRPFVRSNPRLGDAVGGGVRRAALRTRSDYSSGRVWKWVITHESELRSSATSRSATTVLGVSSPAYLSTRAMGMLVRVEDMETSKTT